MFIQGGEANARAYPIARRNQFDKPHQNWFALSSYAALMAGNSISNSGYASNSSHQGKMTDLQAFILSVFLLFLPDSLYYQGSMLGRLGLFLGLLFSVTLGLPAAQITNQWLTALDQISTNGFQPAVRLASCAAMDKWNNVLVGGAVTSNQLGQIFLSKVSPAGQVLWEVLMSSSLQTSLSTAPECLTTDSKGNIYLAIKTSDADIFHTTLIKFDSNGRKLWSRVENCLFIWSPAYAGHSLAVAPDDSVYFLGLYPVLQGGDFVRYDLSLSRIHANGHTSWRTDFPTGYYATGTKGFGHCLQLDGKGNAYVAGGKLILDTGLFQSFAAKIDPRGRIVWNTPLDGNVFCSVACATNGNICAGGDTGYAVFDNNGQVINQADSMFETDIHGLAQDGNFLATQSADSWLIKISQQTGRQVWRTMGGSAIGNYQYKNNLIAKNDGGFLVSGSAYTQSTYYNEFFLTSLDANGNQRWSEYDPLSLRRDPFLHPYPLGRWWMFPGPSNTVRAVINLADQFSGAQSMALRVESLAVNIAPTTPVITVSPVDVTWDGTNSVSLSVTATPGDVLQYQWQTLSGAVDGATNAIFTIPAAQLPEARAYYFCTVTDGTNSINSRTVEISLPGIVLKPNPPDEGGNQSLSFFANRGISFQIICSTNLVDWVPWDGSTYSYQMSIQMPVQDESRVFYRARQVP